jgi:diacylglycerol kinase family enzyme
MASQPRGFGAGAVNAAPLYVVLNVGSGHEDADAAASKIAGVFQGARRPYDIIRVGESTSMEQATRQAVAGATRSGGIVVGAGGDGTLNAVAHRALRSGCPFGVIPQGTFNYFARSHGIPTETDEAARALLSAAIRPVRVGLVNERLFLVNASLGLYPEALDTREEQKQKHGRRRSVAWWATLLTVMRENHPMRLRIELQQTVRELATLTLFVGINPLQFEQAGLEELARNADELTAVVLKPVSRGRLLWLMAKGAAGRLAHDRGVEAFQFSTLAVSPSNPRVRRLKVATDGETRWMSPPLEFRLAPEPLHLLVPVADSSQEQAPE